MAEDELNQRAHSEYTLRHSQLLIFYHAVISVRVGDE